MSYDTLVRTRGTTVTIGSRTSAVSSGGSVSATYTNTATALCWIQPASAQEQTLYGAERGRNAYRLFFLAGTAITNSDRVTVTIGGEARTLDVLGVELPGEMSGGPLKRVEAVAQETLPRA